MSARPGRSATAGVGLGVLAAIVVSLSASVLLYRRHLRQRTARLYGIQPERVTFRCGLHSWVRSE
jgi:hypothetical protein